MKAFLYTVGSVILFVLAIVALQTAGWVSYDFWGRKYENSRREIFEESKAYKHGTIRDLENLMLAYEAAETDEHRAAIKQTIQHRAAAFNPDDLPQHVRQFINKL